MYRRGKIVDCHHCFPYLLRRKDIAMWYDIIAATAPAGWVYLIAARGAFWLASVRDDASRSLQAPWPTVVAVVPARDEAECIAQSIGSLLDQDFAGAFSVILVDDQSSDGTAAVALRAAQMRGASDRLSIVSGQTPPAGWMGKTWAQQQGIELALRQSPSYLLLTDADIVHAPDTLAWLVAQAQDKGSVLTSLMAKLNCESVAERMLIPAFIFFFQMLYPFRWVNVPRGATAAAAGGCMLVGSDALARAGGIAAIRDAVIDDCALARRMKQCGPIWLGLTERARSIRIYPGLSDIRKMVARSAYAQLHYSPIKLVGTVAGLALIYAAPVVFALFGSGLAQMLGLASWGLMAAAFVPTLRFYRMSPLWAVALPAIAVVYLAFTVDSAHQHARRGGAAWKGRIPLRT
jgi:hopene-associated glycosyltransferase HpnB